MIEVVDTNDRLTIEDGNIKASVVGALVTVVVLGACMIGCSLALDVPMSDSANRVVDDRCQCNSPAADRARDASIAEPDCLRPGEGNPVPGEGYFVRNVRS